jgi:hypothetical protein
MQVSVLLLVGVLLLIAGVTLVFIKRQGAAVGLILLLGFLMSLVPAVMPNVGDAVLKGWGLEAHFTKDPNAQVPDTTSTLAAQIAPLQQSVKQLQDAVSKQNEVNKTLTSKIEANAGGDHSAIVVPNINSTNEAATTNSQYTVFVFYKSPRVAQARELLKALIGAGFQASAISTTFEDVGQLAADGTTYVQPTERGLKIQKDVEAIAAKLGMPGIMLGGPYPLKRGDIQVFLY